MPYKKRYGGSRPSTGFKPAGAKPAAGVRGQRSFVRQKADDELNINEEITALGEENFFHADYEETLAPVYGDAADPESLVVEGGVVE